jgi:hypothetical protein
MVEFTNENIWLIVNFILNFYNIYYDDMNYQIVYVICYFLYLLYDIFSFVLKNYVNLIWWWCVNYIQLAKSNGLATEKTENI